MHTFRHGIKVAAIIAALAAFGLTGGTVQAAAQWNTPPSSAFSVPTSQQILPAELNRLLHDKSAHKPLMLQIGSRVLFAQAHIAGSEYVGAGATPEGLQQLRTRVQPLPHNTFIVLYCGCCPWGRCPNVGPAYKTLVDMGFNNVKVLHMDNNLGADWAAKGYPVESGK